MPFIKNDPNINRNGRPLKSQSWSELIRLTGEMTDVATKRQFKFLVVEQLYLRAVAGDISAIREIFDRTDGKPKTAELVSSKSGLMSQLDLDNPQLLRTLLLTAQAAQKAYDGENQSPQH